MYVIKGDLSYRQCTNIVSIPKSSNNNYTSYASLVSTSSGDNLCMMFFIISRIVATIVVFGS